MRFKGSLGEMGCTLNSVEIALPLFFAGVFLIMSLVTFFVVDKRKKERMHVGQTYYMSMDMVGAIILIGAVLALSVIAPLGRLLWCLQGIAQ